MKKILFFSIIGALALNLAGCKEKEIRTVEYFKELPKEELETFINQCKQAKSMKAHQAAECENAVEAFNKNKMAGKYTNPDLFKFK